MFFIVMLCQFLKLYSDNLSVPDLRISIINLIYLTVFLFVNLRGRMGQFSPLKKYFYGNGITSTAMANSYLIKA